MFSSQQINFLFVVNVVFHCNVTTFQNNFFLNLSKIKNYMPSSENHNLNPILIMYIFFLKYVDPDSMETNEKAKTFSTKSLKDEHGNYPVWMSMRRVQKQKKKNRRRKRKDRRRCEEDARKSGGTWRPDPPGQVAAARGGPPRRAVPRHSVSLSLSLSSPWFSSLVCPRTRLVNWDIFWWLSSCFMTQIIPPMFMKIWF